ncbi:60S acidic ribosomal protein P0 [Pelomyxa schiedti]|nr:60S acidic ribosomal protein P0 [Pelomyxa schiedti]
MPVKVVDKKKKKAAYIEILGDLLDKYPRIMLVTSANVGSAQMQKIRQSIRNEGVILMGKNTLIRKIVRDHVKKTPELEPLLSHIKGEIGFVFTNGDLVQLRDKLQSIKVDAPAKAGSLAPNEVVIPAGNTGLEPTQTSFLQALNIASKINKGQVEIISDVTLLKKGDKVGPSEAALLAKLNIRPFSYGLLIKAVYEGGFVFDHDMIDMMNDAEFIVNKLRKGIQAMAAVSLALRYPTVTAVPHVLNTGFQNLISLTLSTAYNFPAAERMKTAATAAPVAVSTPVEPKKGKPTKVDEPEPEPETPAEPEKPAEEEVDLGGAFDLFA